MKKFIFTYWIVVATLFIGWVLNIVQIAKASALTGLLIVKIIGVFLAPLGGVLGLVGLF